MTQLQSGTWKPAVDDSEWDLEDKFRAAAAQLKGLEEEEERKLKKKRGAYYETTLRLYREAQVLVRRKVPSSIVDKWRDRFRELWLSIPRSETDRRTSLAVVHGLVERADAGSLGSAEAWLENVCGDLLSECAVRAHELERDALKLGCGLPVLDFERVPTGASALFGVVEEVEDGEARVLMSIPEGETDPTAPIWEACMVPAVDLPTAYAIPGVWVAWVDRIYNCDGTLVQKGRFEPASSRNTVKPSPSLLVEASGFV